jgi:hypothetical protein
MPLQSTICWPSFDNHILYLLQRKRVRIGPRWFTNFVTTCTEFYNDWWPHPACLHVGHEHGMSVSYTSHTCTSLFNLHIEPSHFIYRFYVFFNGKVRGIRAINVYNQFACQIKINLHWLSSFAKLSYGVFQPVCRGILNSNAFANNSRSLLISVTPCSALFCDFIDPSRFLNCCHLDIKAFFFLWLYSPIRALAASIKLSVSL